MGSVESRPAMSVYRDFNTRQTTLAKEYHWQNSSEQFFMRLADNDLADHE